MLSLYVDQVNLPILQPYIGPLIDHRANHFSSKEINYDEWDGDMKSRVYWSTIMHEAILAQELDLSPTGLSRLEDYVPIPKFIDSPAPRQIIESSPRGDIAFFQYHFLAQVAHRIILTRIRDSLYFFCKDAFPSLFFFLTL